MRKTIRDLVRRTGDFLGKYINGVRGAVSLLLAMLLTPMLTIALLLVESARYQNVVQLMEELMDISGFSTLADYDPYLDSRFGLLSVSQEKDVNTAFGEYLDVNVEALGDSATLDSKTAEGAFPLSERDVLKQQMLEASELTAVHKMLSEGLDIPEALKSLTEKLRGDRLEKLSKVAEATKTITDLAKALADLVENVTEFYTKLNSELAASQQTYMTEASEFHTAAMNLVNALKEAKKKIEEDQNKQSASQQNSGSSTSSTEAPPEPPSPYDDEAVKTAISDLMTARNEYKSAATGLAGKLNEVQKSFHTTLTKTNTVVEKVRKLTDQDKDYKKYLEEEKKKAQAAERGETYQAPEATDESFAVYKIVFDVSNEVLVIMERYMNNSFDLNIESEQRQLTDQAVYLNALQDKTIDDTWTDSKVSQEYGYVIIKSVAELGSSLQESITKANKVSQMSESEGNNIRDLLALLSNLVNIPGFYESDLDAVVGGNFLYNKDIDINLSAKALIVSVSSLCDAGNNLVDALTSGGIVKRLVNICTAMADLGAAITGLIGAVVTWVTDAAASLGTFLMSGPKEWVNSLMIYSYSAYNMPNRTNFYTGTGLLGTPYKTIFKMGGGTYKNTPLHETLANVLTNLSKLQGDSPMFKGAEAEYLVVGSTSEQLNQLVTFFDLFMLRVVLDLGPVFTEPAIKAAAAAAAAPATVAAPLVGFLVKLAFTLAEACLDTIILSNSSNTKEFLYKKDIYMSVPGMKILQQDLLEVLEIGSSLKGDIQKVIGKNLKESSFDPAAPLPGTVTDPAELEKFEPKPTVPGQKDPTYKPDEYGKGVFNAGYTEHMILLMILMVPQDVLLKRMQNLIQMEAMAANKTEFTFALDKSYTYLHTDVTYTMNPLFKVGGLTDNGLLTASSKQYIGY